MGKKGKDKKKVKGTEKTALKTEKKINLKHKKEIAAIGEDDIEKIVAEIEKEEQNRLKVTEVAIDAPSRRANFSFLAHPDKDELILFGGEYYNGQKTFVYNDLFTYNISKNKWTLIKAPAGPPPRCGHQSVAISANKGQLWVFGGEYASPTQSQFYHYRDLWVYHISDKKWEKISAPNGPSSRSGHRMVYMKKQLFVFGGFHDNLRDYKYFNDLHIFNLETYQWTKIEPKGTAPAPRSACNMIALPDGRIVIFGGYSKTRLKKDVDKGQTHTDSFVLTPEKNDETGTKWKWNQIKIGGTKISPRCGLTLTTAPNNKIYCYGGVYDVEDDDEKLSGVFYKDLYCMDTEKVIWNLVSLNKESDSQRKENTESMDIEEETTEDKEQVVADDGVFTVKVGPATFSANTSLTVNQASGDSSFWPSARMNCGLAVKKGNLYLFGGMLEEGSKQYTLNDLYSLDLHKLDEWKVIINDDLANQEWLGSESESSDEDDEDEDSESSEDSMDTD